MNYITKMFEIYEIEKIQLDYPDNIKPFYPEFTPEMQLKLIQLICKTCKTLNIHKFTETSEWWFGADEYWSEYKYEVRNKNFERGLAQLVTELKEVLPKEEVRKILTHE